MKNGWAVQNGKHVNDVLVGGLMLPVHCAGFEFENVIDNERSSPGLGRTIAYHGGALGECTVYIYNKGMTHIPDGPTSQVVRHEFEMATRDVLAAQQYAPDRNIALVDRYGTGSPDRGPEFLCAEFILNDTAGARRTFPYVSGAQRHFVKIRITLKTNDATDPMARNFVDAFAATLWRRQEIGSEFGRGYRFH